MILRREAFSKLKPSYFFSTIAKLRREYEEKHPDKKVLSLGIGDAVLPLVSGLKKPLESLIDQMLTQKGFVGYGDAPGWKNLREKIAVHYLKNVDKEEIFVTNGAKSSLLQLQNFFSQVKSVGIISPTYPVYADGSLMQGIETIHHLPLLAENDFYYDLSRAPEMDLLYLCHPNNPTGTTLTTQQLTKWVDICRERNIILIVDNAYSAYIQSENSCKTIYSIPGARDVAIEINSFSKSLGFSGVRGGWVVFPKNLKYKGGTSMHSDWTRFYSTTFNGANIFAQQGMLAFFNSDVNQQAKAQAAYYMDNAKKLKTWFLNLGFKVYGGENAPYVWVDVSPLDGWEFFQYMLEEKQIVVVPGEGFGKEGKNFVRLSSFVGEQDLKEIEKRLFEKPLHLKQWSSKERACR